MNVSCYGKTKRDELRFSFQKRPNFGAEFHTAIHQNLGPLELATAQMNLQLQNASVFKRVNTMKKEQLF